jgi:hypothetical protein
MHILHSFKGVLVKSPHNLSGLDAFEAFSSKRLKIFANKAFMNQYCVCCSGVCVRAGRRCPGVQLAACVHVHAYKPAVTVSCFRSQLADGWS